MNEKSLIRYMSIVSFIIRSWLRLYTFLLIGHVWLKLLFLSVGMEFGIWNFLNFLFTHMFLALGASYLLIFKTFIRILIAYFCAVHWVYNFLSIHFLDPFIQIRCFFALDASYSKSTFLLRRAFSNRNFKKCYKLILIN